MELVRRCAWLAFFSKEAVYLVKKKRAINLNVSVFLCCLSKRKSMRDWLNLWLVEYVGLGDDWYKQLGRGNKFPKISNFYSVMSAECKTHAYTACFPMSFPPRVQSEDLRSSVTAGHFNMHVTLGGNSTWLSWILCLARSHIQHIFEGSIIYIVVCVSWGFFFSKHLCFMFIYTCISKDTNGIWFYTQGWSN